MPNTIAGVKIPDSKMARDLTQLMSTKNDRLFLITGATGKTGATAARLLLQRGYRDPGPCL